MTEKMGKYIYCIINSGITEKPEVQGLGMLDNELYAVCYNDIAAVLSTSPVIRYKTSSENLMAHEKAIEEVMKKYTVLPVKFATIAEDEQKVLEILKREYDRFKNLLKKVENKMELGIKAVFKEDSVYRIILEKYKDISVLKETINSLPPEKTHYQRVKIGELVESALQNEVTIYRDSIMDVLSPLASEVKSNRTYGERMLVNAAFLVDRNKEKTFDEKINELDEKYGGIMKLKYVGNVPPFNFVNLVIQI